MSIAAPTDARGRLLAELRVHALVIGEVVLTSGATAQYLIDAKRAILRPAGFLALAELVAAQAQRWGATAVGGMTMGADPIACAALAGGADVKAFFVRKEVKQHGLARRIEGPLLDAGDRCLLVEDVVTTGGSTIRALEAIQAEGHQVCGVLAICDRLAGRRGRDPRGRGRALRGADHDRRGVSGAAGPVRLAAPCGGCAKTSWGGGGPVAAWRSFSGMWRHGAEGRRGRGPAASVG